MARKRREGKSAINRVERMNPGEDIDKHVRKIKRMFRRAEVDINEILRRVDIDSLTIEEQRKIIRDVNEILRAVDNEVPVEVEKSMQDIYEHGRARSLIAFGFYKDIGEARKFLRSRRATDSRAHRAYLASNIEVLTSDLLKATNNTAEQVKTTVRRTAGEVLRESYRQQEGSLSAARRIKRQLEDAGNIAIIDRAGRRWSLDFYAEVVTRTKLAQAHREATEIEAEEQGAGYVLVSRHGDACEKCTPWEARILRIHDGIEGDMPTLDDATEQGLFHPNCKHNVTPIRRLDRAPSWAIF